MKNKLFQLSVYTALLCLHSISLNANNMPSYTCPNKSEVKAALITAIKQHNQEVRIPTRFGLLQASLGIIDVNHINALTFSYATFLFGDTKDATYEVSCAYEEPHIIFYTYSDYGNASVYMGASPNWIPDNNQQYATCTYSVEYCVFMKKFEGSCLTQKA
jgi:hypothetical protein